MLVDDDGLPLISVPDGYPVAVPENGILVDDPGTCTGHHCRLVRAVFEKIFRADADTWWNEVAEVLAPKDHELRTWLTSSFFEHHLKHYSKSRRKVPNILAALRTIWPL